MDHNVATIALAPSEVLFQISCLLVLKDKHLQVKLPRVTTWNHALDETRAVLEEAEDGTVLLFQKRTIAERKKLQQMALEQVAKEKESSMHTRVGRSVRTMYDIDTLPMPKRASKETVRRLKETMKPNEQNGRLKGPHVITLRMTNNETLPLITTNIKLTGIDATDNHPSMALNGVETIWDTGAQWTCITDDLLTPDFLEFLKDAIHDPYRSSSGARVQIDAVIGFTNSALALPMIALVVPRSLVPNERSGVILGQKCVIDHLLYRSIPRSFLLKNGEDVGEEIWGDIVIEKQLTLDDEVLTLENQIQLS